MSNKTSQQSSVQKVSLSSKTGLLSRLFGPVADEIGKDLAQWYRKHRRENLEKVLEKADEKLTARNSERTQPKLNLVYPILDKSSFVDDAFLQEKWANLLAAVISKETCKKVHVAFPHILEQLSSLEAQILDLTIERLQGIPASELSSRGLAKEGLVRAFKITERDFQIAFRNLIRLNLCQFPASGLRFIDDKDARFVRNMDAIVCVTEFGISFVESCKS